MMEILAPAGNKQAFITAVNCGADAIYLGLKKFSARNNAENFSKEELSYCINYAKLFGVKVYAAMNILIKDSELEDFFREIETAGNLGVDAFIVQDMFLGKILKKKFPDIVLHLSTQAGVCNIYGAKLALEYGFTRVILARETKKEDIKAISKIIETEIFVQGALCSSFSGHCYMSALIGGNSGNRGLCKQPCRKRYTYYVDGKPIKSGYALSISDLSLGGKIKEYTKLGVTSFKIEGRMRRKEYVGTAVRYYRSLADDLIAEENARHFSDMKQATDRNNLSPIGLGAEENAQLFSDMKHATDRKNSSPIGLGTEEIARLFSDMKHATDRNNSSPIGLGAEEIARHFSDMKRAFNRNDYTEGLAEHQPENYISDKIQGHIGESVGRISKKIKACEFLVKSKELGEDGDSYKILRSGKEIGSGIFVKNVGEGFLIKTNSDLFAGDDVRITTDVSIARKIESCLKKYRLKIYGILSQNARARFLIFLIGEEIFDCHKRVGSGLIECKTLSKEDIDLLGFGTDSVTIGNNANINKNMWLDYFTHRGKYAEAKALREGNYFLYESDDRLDASKNFQLNHKDILECFSKTGEYPFLCDVYYFAEGVFVPKSKLNEMRRKIYEMAFSFFNHKIFNVCQVAFTNKISQNTSRIKYNKNTSYLLTNFNINMHDIKHAVYFPDDYNRLSMMHDFTSECSSQGIKSYLYMPAYASGKDLQILQNAAKEFNGLFAESYYAIALAEEWKKEIFIGFGCNIFNQIDIEELKNRNITLENITLSKELSEKEILSFQDGLAVFCGGNVAIMDLIYCPFNRKCGSCNIKEIFLSDDCERTYKVLKYKLSECRFVVYNPYDLKDRFIPGKYAFFDKSFSNINEQKTSVLHNNGVI